MTTAPVAHNFDTDASGAILEFFHLFQAKGSARERHAWATENVRANQLLHQLWMNPAVLPAALTVSGALSVIHRSAL